MKKVLIIDDEQSITRMVKLSLESEGEFQVIELNSAKDLIQCVESNPPDIIILDVIMPDADGIQIARMLAEHEASKAIPIIFLTAVVPNSQQMPVLEGLGDYPRLSKPVGIQDLLDCIQRQLENKPFQVPEA